MSNRPDPHTGPSMGAPFDIWLLVFSNFMLLDATGPIQVFSTANDEARDAGRTPPYRIHLVAEGGGLVASSSGVSLACAPLPAVVASGSTIVVSGGRVADLPCAGSAALDWLQEADRATARTCGVCTGAFVLARAGLLDGRRAATHWQDVAELRRQHPALLVQDDAITVRDGKFHTSAGISAGMDLALALVEEDLGHAAALAVARRLVLFLKRPGGQRQFGTAWPQPEEQGTCAALTAWLRPRLRQEIGIEAMAAACALSVRTLHRRLRQEAGTTPAQLLARLRLEAACQFLERPGMTVKRAARDSGYGSEYNLRRAFAAQLGVLPSEYHARFSQRCSGRR
jgi:transcriptional regulator GlxA family with amidase domain